VKIVLWLLVVGLALLALDRVGLWMERRGWIYYRRRKPASSALGNAFLEVQALLEPEKRTLLELRQEEPHEEDESGEPPDTSDHGRGA